MANAKNIYTEYTPEFIKEFYNYNEITQTMTTTFQYLNIDENTKIKLLEDYRVACPNVIRIGCYIRWAVRNDTKVNSGGILLDLEQLENDENSLRVFIKPIRKSHPFKLILNLNQTIIYQKLTQVEKKLMEI